MRRRGYNLRHVLLIGTPRQVDQLLQKLRAYRQFGLNIAGVYLTEQAPPEMTPVPGGCLKDTAELNRLVKSGTIDQIFVTLPLEQAGKLVEIQQWLDDEPITLHFIPDVGDLAKLRGRMEEFDGLPIISLQTSPLHGWNSILKRVMDLSIGGLALVFFSPLMLLIAMAIKLTSPDLFFIDKSEWAWMVEDSGYSSSGRWSKMPSRRPDPCGLRPMIRGSRRLGEYCGRLVWTNYLN